MYDRKARKSGSMSYFNKPSCGEINYADDVFTQLNDRRKKHFSKENINRKTITEFPKLSNHVGGLMSKSQSNFKFESSQKMAHNVYLDAINQGVLPVAQKKKVDDIKNKILNCWSSQDKKIQNDPYNDFLYNSSR